MNDINGFTFFRSYHEALKDLDEESKRDILSAIVNYVFEDIEPQLDGFKKTIWILLLPNLKSSKNKSNNAKIKSTLKQNKIKNKSKQNQTEINDLMNKDKEKDKNKNKKRKEEIYSITATNGISIVDFVEKNFNKKITPIEEETILNWVNEYGEELVKLAIKKSIFADVKKFSYIKGILENWERKNLRTIKEIREAEDPKENMFDYDWLADD